MAGTYNLAREFSDDVLTDDVSSAPHWVLAVVRLAVPLSYSRRLRGSVHVDASTGARTRGKTLVVTSDCIQLQVQNSKESHVKTLSASLVQGRFNYLVEVLPGDWVLAWMVHGREKLTDLVDRIRRGQACNGFGDGLKFVGRVESVRKTMHRDRAGGAKTSRYQVQGFGFRELDTQVFYDKFLASNSVESQNIGRWLARMSLDIRELFASELNGVRDNVHLIIPRLVEILLGRGFNANVTDDPALRQQTGGGVTQGQDGTTQEAPFAYLVPTEVGDLLGRSNPSKAGGVLAYSDILTRVVGVQKYSGSAPDQHSVFAPNINVEHELTRGNQKFTGINMLGAYLPNFPDFTDQPLWSVLQQYLNPVVNEMYTCLRVDGAGQVVPTLVLRQIPFTTTALAQKLESSAATFGSSIAGSSDAPSFTPFMSLPRWVLPPVLVTDVSVGRSDAVRCNFVHVFGQSALEAKNVPITDQLVQNPPVRDDLDILRSGLHTYMTTVACRALNEVGTTPGAWMELIADHLIGAQYTLSGTVTGTGIQAPVCEGDNLEFDGVVYHIESVTHQASCDPGGGSRTWTTSFSLSNGLRAEDSASDVDADFPMYPGFRKDDNTALDPGVSADDDDSNADPAAVEAPPFDPSGDANA